MVKITINGAAVEVQVGATILESAKAAPLMVMVNKPVYSHL